MKDKTIRVPSGDDNCPADALMYDYRHRVKADKEYAKNISYNSISVDFFRDMSTLYEENERNIIFFWDEIPEEELPPLIVKLRKNGDKYTLNYLKELGKDEVTLIKGKQRKGKNKNGKINIIKEEGEDR